MVELDSIPQHNSVQFECEYLCGFRLLVRFMGYANVVWCTLLCMQIIIFNKNVQSDPIMCKGRSDCLSVLYRMNCWKIANKLIFTFDVPIRTSDTEAFAR